ncbi:MAG: DUF1844 domain-containing protein [Phycisphaerales bacterium]|nr:DUF1844 domain-containing protein [Phycisphaerales bacterium]
MADEPKKIIVDDDWKAEARREKERLVEETSHHEQLPQAGFIELLNLVVMQALGALGMLMAPGGKRIPAQPELAKYFIDLLQVIDDKTKGNLTADEKKLLDQALYDLRMRYVEIASGGAPMDAVGRGPAIPGI